MKGKDLKIQLKLIISIKKVDLEESLEKETDQGQIAILIEIDQDHSMGQEEDLTEIDPNQETMEGDLHLQDLQMNSLNAFIANVTIARMQNRNLIKS